MKQNKLPENPDFKLPIPLFVWFGALTDDADNRKELLEQFNSSNIWECRQQAAELAEDILESADEAKDVVQEAYMAYWKYLLLKKRAESPKALLMTIVRNAALDCLRTHRQKETEDAALVHTSNDLESAIESSDSLSHLLQLMDRLPENHREAMRMRFEEGLSYEEMERLTGKSANTLRQYVSRPRSVLRECLAKEADSLESVLCTKSAETCK